LRIVHTFILQKERPSLGREYYYTMTLSALLAKQAYGNIHLYTNEQSLAVIKDLQIPYDSINTQVLSTYEYDTFSVAKLKVYQAQTEEFIHIDHDTLLFKELTLPKKPGIVFSHKETFTPDSLYELLQYSSAYLEGLQELQNFIPPEFIHYNAQHMPNMNIVVGKNLSTVRRAAQTTLALYRAYKHIFDANYSRACLLEQYLFTQWILTFDKSFKDYIEFGTCFLTHNHPLICNEGGHIYESYPITFQVAQPKERFVINNRAELKNLVGFDFSGWTHLNGYKNAFPFVYLTLSYIHTRFGREYIDRVWTLINPNDTYRCAAELAYQEDYGKIL